VIEDGDEVFLLAAEEHIRTVMRELRRSVEPVRRVMIAGGGNIGLRVAQALRKQVPGQGPSRSTGGVPSSWPPP
jgi:trk system potassium uptake protein TrkA